jgi:hypothetical protein
MGFDQRPSAGTAARGHFSEAGRFFMNPSKPLSASRRGCTRSCAFASFIGGFIRLLSLSLLVLWLGVTVTIAARDVTQSSWLHKGYRCVVATLEETFEDAGLSNDLGVEISPVESSRDEMRSQMEETRARRKLAKEMRQRKSSGRGVKAAWSNGHKI